MADVVVLGAGICGLAAATLLAQDGHRVVVAERDGDDVPSSGPDAWQRWSRRGVAQFRHAHWLQPRGRALLDEHLPAVTAAMRDAGCRTHDMLRPGPPPLAGMAAQPGDERFVTVTGRRPVVERAVAGVAEQLVDVRRGVAVAGLLTGPPDLPGVPHVTGVLTATGEEIRADLVVDATGRRSPLPGWLDAIGARPPVEEAGTSGFFYYTRYFRSPDGPPPARTGLLAPLGSLSLLYLPADNGTWSVTVYASARDAAMRALRHTDVWTRVVRRCPLHAHLLDGQPISDVLAIGGTLDRYRRFVVDGLPVATGVVAVGDSWACTNPSIGRGMTLALLHATRLCEVVRAQLGAPGRLAEAFDAVTEAELTPWYRATVAVDHDRQAVIDALVEGRPVPPPADDGAALGRALAVAMAHDPEAYRAFLDIAGVLGLPQEVLSRPGLAERITEVARSAPPLPVPGPDRQELLALVG